MNLRNLAFHAHPHLFLGSLSFISAVFSLGLSTTTAFLPLLFHLSIVIVYVSRVNIFRFPGHFLIFWITLSAGASFGWLRATLGALSTPATSLGVLYGQSLLTTAAELATIVFYNRSRTRLPLPSFSQVTLFPALWTTVWFFIASVISPVGYLGLPAPVHGLVAYEWMTSIFGSMTRYWLVAAWAVVLSRTVEWWFIAASQEPEEESLIAHPYPNYGTVHSENGTSNGHSKKSSGSNMKSTLCLATLLLVLTIPSYFISNLPLPVSPVDNVTPLRVGCVLPSKQIHKTHTLTFDHYLKETKSLISQSDILLWPESAVSFRDSKEREEKLHLLEQAGLGDRFVAPSFEENYVDPNNPHKTLKRTGVVVLSQNTKNGTEPHLIYWKQNLVPIAESFSLEKGVDPPSIQTLELKNPSGITKLQWGGHTRPLPVTASICLDFAIPSTFSSLVSRPALILGPARTWSVDVGLAMWEQARARAEETGSMVLWCDGGDGGVSGIVGGGFDSVMQVGEGSWIRKVGVPFAFDERRTVYARTKGVLGIVLVWVVVLSGSLELAGFRFLMLGIQTLRIPSMRWVTGLLPVVIRRKHDPERPLIQVDEEPNLLD
ncbi:hypothetical protein D9758_002333 [Tetrapyrgos nigripes]|uniref:CN hydrolase domain-containing protein n=1 Tax=Tetrapyrgos nigripes TaxID=182062 RepID=A0A8H5GPM8_9AGAR|nr:hypothetical protein D9758_002333 [Tetrapyrgos nigripes]